MTNLTDSNNYARLYSSIKKIIDAYQESINTPFIELSYQIGKEILSYQKTAMTGSDIYRQLGIDLRYDFPFTSGLYEENTLRKFTLIASRYSLKKLKEKGYDQLNLREIEEKLNLSLGEGN